MPSVLWTVAWPRSSLTASRRQTQGFRVLSDRFQIHRQIGIGGGPADSWRSYRDKIVRRREILAIADTLVRRGQSITAMPAANAIRASRAPAISDKRRRDGGREGDRADARVILKMISDEGKRIG